MKNIFLKETDQESELYYNTHANVYGHSKNVLSMGGWVVNQFIYITSDESPKNGDYMVSLVDDESYEEVYKVRDHFVDEEDRKIIMTNDPTLIEDGVQEVSSQFLSFLAENPVDYVRVEKWLDDEGKRFYSLDFSPKKENIIDNWLEKNGNPEIMKQVEKEAEELELQYYAEKRYPEDGSFTIMDIDIAEYRRFAFIEGAKWQAKRMYSEEEVKELLKRFAPHIRYNHKELPHTWSQVVQEWFAENKK